MDERSIQISYEKMIPGNGFYSCGICAMEKIKNVVVAKFQVRVILQSILPLNLTPLFSYSCQFLRHLFLSLEIHPPGNHDALRLG
jgi:hypothetical protein